MAKFTSSKAYRAFAESVKNKARHIFDTECQTFLEAVVSTGEKRAICLKAGTQLWRSQLGHDGWYPKEERDENGGLIDTYEVPEPYESKRMVPLTDRAHEGRVNPKGIACYYFSTDDKTAVAEARPWLGAYVSVAEFKILRDLRLVDCSGLSTRAWLTNSDSSPEVNEKRVWESINRAFTAPVTRSDDVADYAPTQVIAEALRFNGFDGIKYGSSLGEGRTIAVFDLSAARLVSRCVYEVDSIEVKSSLASSPYYTEDWDGSAPKSE
jgi:hypothetical protein